MVNTHTAKTIINENPRANKNLAQTWAEEGCSDTGIVPAMALASFGYFMAIQLWKKSVQSMLAVIVMPAMRIPMNVRDVTLGPELDI